MSDVPGLLRKANDPDSIIAHLQTTEVAALKQTGVVDKGMIPKVDSAVAAIKAGVEKVSFVDGRARIPAAGDFTDEGWVRKSCFEDEHVKRLSNELKPRAGNAKLSP